MKCNWIWSSLVGLLIGIAVGFALSAWSRHQASFRRSALLREFSLAQVGQAQWDVLEDRIYDPFPTQGRSQRVARRIVARAEMAGAELEKFTAQFQGRAEKAMESYGAVSKAQFDLEQGTTRVAGGSPVKSGVNLPRRYYSIGDTHGVADIGYIAESGHVTVIVSFMEGL